MQVIPVIYLASEGYSKILAVSILSLLENKDADTVYKLYVLVQKPYSGDSMLPFELMKCRYSGFDLEFVPMSDAFSDTKTNNAGVGKETMYRLLAAKVLLNVDKCIYLDADTLVLDDLTAMYNFDIGDSYISGIHPPHFLSMAFGYDQNKGRFGRGNAFGMKDFDQYIGCGVMLMNLAKIREDNMTELFLKNVPENSLPLDQDILNLCCYGRITELPVKYCLDLHELNDLAWYRKNMTEVMEDIESAFMHPVVVHFSDRFKPWKMMGLWFEQDWWRYACMLGFQDHFWDSLVISLSEQSGKDSINELGGQLEKMKRGISYRIGRFVTWLPRRLYYKARRVKK